MEFLLILILLVVGIAVLSRNSQPAPQHQYIILPAESAEETGSGIGRLPLFLLGAIALYVILFSA